MNRQARQALLASLLPRLDGSPARGWFFSRLRLREFTPQERAEDGGGAATFDSLRRATHIDVDTRRCGGCPVAHTIVAWHEAGHILDGVLASHDVGEARAWEFARMRADGLAGKGTLLPCLVGCVGLDSEPNACPHPDLNGLQEALDRRLPQLGAALREAVRDTPDWFQVREQVTWRPAAEPDGRVSEAVHVIRLREQVGHVDDMRG